ncbi:MAG TPA: NAD(P)/FAD-dependent oxidoreductase [Burkholderiales bacterium]|nr:NAD(P)/FAD-dependent oxidoreductase [Burkholderiales bacterium]
MSTPNPVSSGRKECDVLVVGGGPAGSTIAALLAEKGWRVTLIEKAHHPRFHIGESLLPHNLPIFKRLGVLEQVDAIGLKKPGADFNSNLEVSGHHQFHFSFALDKGHPYAYEVRRSEFDHLLLRNSAAKGVQVLEGVRVTGVDFPNGGDPVARAVDEQGQEHGWTCRFFVDASGRDTLLSKHFRLKQKSTQHASAAIFGHFLNVDRREGDYVGNISVYWFEHGWFWMIPLKDGAMSVGAVCRPEYLKQRKNSPAEYLLQTLALGHPEMRHRMRNATLIGNEARATGNYSYQSARMRGERYIMVGDAYAFVDPIFSSGVLLGMNSGVRGADAVDAWLRNDPAAEALFRHFERMVDRGVKTFSWFICRFNSPGMRSLLLHPGNPFRVQEAVISLLAGDVFRDIGVRSRFWLFKFFYAMFSLKHARESFRLWLLRMRNPRVAFTGGTTPLDTE